MEGVQRPHAQGRNDFRNRSKKINDAQKAEVLANLPDAIAKAIDPSKLFDIEQWISITVNALTPTLESLFTDEAKAAAAEIGKPELNPFNDTARVQLHASIGLMARSYQTTVRNTMETLINEGMESGQGLADISASIGSRYEDLNGYAAERVAKTESFRTSNAALKQTWKESGVVKTIKWYTASGEPCIFCEQLDGKVISIDDNFFNQGDSMTIDDKTLNLDYSDVGAPPLHPLCMCIARPEDISID